MDVNKIQPDDVSIRDFEEAFFIFQDIKDGVTQNLIELAKVCAAARLWAESQETVH